MSDYEIIMIILSIANLMLFSGELMLALLNFLDKKNKRK